MGKIGLRKIFGVDDDDEDEEEEEEGKDGGEFGEIGEPPSQRAPAAGETAKNAFYQTLKNINTWTSIFMNSLSNNLLLQSSAVPMPRFSRDANSFEKVKVKLLAAAVATHHLSSQKPFHSFPVHCAMTGNIYEIRDGIHPKHVA